MSAVSRCCCHKAKRRKSVPRTAPTRLKILPWNTLATSASVDSSSREPRKLRVWRASLLARSGEALTTSCIRNAPIRLYSSQRRVRLEGCHSQRDVLWSLCVWQLGARAIEACLVCLHSQSKQLAQRFGILAETTTRRHCSWRSSALISHAGLVAGGTTLNCRPFGSAHCSCVRHLIASVSL